MRDESIIEIKRLDISHLAIFKSVILLFRDVFEMKDFHIPDDKHLLHLLKNKDFIVLGALKRDEVIGGLTAYILHQYYTPNPLIYVYDLAVATDYQRNGIGRMLMAAIIEHGKSLEMEEVFVQADRIDQHALDFYIANGGIAEDVVHFSYPLYRN